MSVFPQMVGPLQTTAQNIGMLVSAITFSTALFSLVLGPFTDRIPRKKILIFCLVLYGFTGLAAYFATDLETLLILRFLQGIGVAGMMLVSMLLKVDLYSGPEGAGDKQGGHDKCHWFGVFPPYRRPACLT